MRMLADKVFLPGHDAAFCPLGIGIYGNAVSHAAAEDMGIEKAFFYDPQASGLHSDTDTLSLQDSL